jgi:hypothetical protein
MSALPSYILSSFFIAFWSGQLAAFQSSTFFSTETPMEIALATSLNDLRQAESATVFFNSMLRYKSEDGSWDSIRVELSARGNSRRIRCDFTSVRIKIAKKEARNTIFDGKKALKLVPPCEDSEPFYDLMAKEFRCYKFYEKISPYYFKTKLVNLTLTATRGRRSKSYQLTSFLIEDDDKTAKRFDAKISDSKLVRPNLVNDTVALKQDFFSFMIDNTDWSNTVQHTIKVIERKDSKVIPLPYDFDMSGFVSASYAIPYDYLPIQTVQERLYRGICREPELVQYVRDYFLMKEQVLNEILGTLQSEIQTSQYIMARNYISEFFEIIKDDKQFEAQISSKCIPNTY